MYKLDYPSQIILKGLFKLICVVGCSDMMTDIINSMVANTKFIARERLLVRKKPPLIITEITPVVI